MKNLCTLLLSLLCAYAMGQETIQNKINDYSGGPGTIVTGFGKPIEIGKIDSEGNFSIPLKEDFKSMIMESLEVQNKSSSDWKTSLPTLERTFGNCNGNVAYTGEKQITIEITTAGMFTVGNMEEQRLIGTIMFANSKEFAEAYMAFGQFKTVPGYQLTWYYFDDIASVKGSCEMESYTQNMEEKYVQSTNYNLDFKAGWNLVKYEVSEVFTDAGGKKYAKSESFVSLDALPKDVKSIMLDKTWQ